MSDQAGHFARIGSAPTCSCGETFPSELWLLRHQRDALRTARDALAEQVEAVRALQRRDEREGPGYDWLIPKGYNQALDEIAAILEAK